MIFNPLNLKMEEKGKKKAKSNYTPVVAGHRHFNFSLFRFLDLLPRDLLKRMHQKQTQEFEARIGTEFYATRTEGIGGVIKTKLADFYVREITKT